MTFEIIGIIASIIVLCSAIFKSADIRRNIAMRFINAAGSVIFIIYGSLIGSISIVILNIIMVIVSITHAALLIKDLKIDANDDIDYMDLVEIRNAWANRSDDPKMAQIKYGVLGVDWSSPMGWGRWEMIMDENGKPHIYSEHMDKDDAKDFSKAILMRLLEEAVVEE